MHVMLRSLLQVAQAIIFFMGKVYVFSANVFFTIKSQANIFLWIFLGNILNGDNILCDRLKGKIFHMCAIIIYYFVIFYNHCLNRLCLIHSCDKPLLRGLEVNKIESFDY